MENVVLITGSSTGIGLETVKLFQSKNWKVAATMRRPEEHADLQRIADVETFCLDVTEPDSIKAAFAAAIAKFGRIDVVVNNAGYGLLGAFEAATPEQVREQFDTNVFGVMNVCRETIPYFREQKRGMIINVTSMAGRTAFPYSSLYNATKFAVEGFTESLTYELEPFNVRMKLIEPGPIKTDFYGRSQQITRKEGLTVYDRAVDRFMDFMNKGGADAPDGSMVAEAIYDAATDGSGKLRYPVNTKGLLFMRSALPFSMYRFITKKVFLR